MKKHEGYILANVRAQSRPGFQGFCRAGRLWSSAPEGETVLLSPEAFNAVKAESMLFVDTAVDAPPDMAVLARVDMPVRHVSGPLEAAAEQARVLEQRAEQLRAALELEEKRAEVEKLEADYAAAKAKNAAAAARSAEKEAKASDAKAPEKGSK